MPFSFPFKAKRTFIFWFVYFFEKNLCLLEGSIHMNNVTIQPGTYATYNYELYRRSIVAESYYNASRAQDKEDVWAYEHWFFGMKGGVILESGACDGLQISTTHLFEKFASWKTIHIEPNDEQFLKLQLNRNSSINIHATLCESERVVHFLSKGVVSGIAESMDSLHLAIHHKPIFRQQISIQDVPKKKCVPVKDILAAIQIAHIDLWIVDVEGAEDLVLEGMDFDSVHVNALIVECFGSDKAKEKRKRDILTRNNFVCSQSGHGVESAFQKRAIKSRRRKAAPTVSDAGGKNCMCIHQSFKPSSRFRNVL